MTVTAASEQAKYRKCWADPRYSYYSPGYVFFPLFKRMVRKHEGTLLDLGCGSGRVARKLYDLGFDVTLSDFVRVPLQHKETERLPFVKINIYGQWPKKNWDWVYCCDVMEHIPPERIDKSLSNIMSHCKQAFFSICFTPDHFGGEIGETLHLTVKPFVWWRDKLREYGKLTEARDLLRNGIFRLEARPQPG